MKRIHIFKPGTHTDMSGRTIAFGETDMSDISSVYDPSLHESPLVIGHPKHNNPAYGWVKSLEYADGGLVAIPQQVNPEFAEMVETGAFKKISASFYQPDAPNNPKPGHYYLRHVGFLGAMAPAVKGLKAIEFADEAEDGIVTLEFADLDPRNVAGMFRGLRDWILGKFGQEEADKALPGWDVQWAADQAAQPDPETVNQPMFADPAADPAPKPVPDPNPPKEDKVDPKEIEAIKQRETALAAAEAVFAEKQASTAAINFADNLIKEGKLIPAQKDAVVSLVTHLSVHGEGEISFGEGSKPARPVDALKAVLSSVPKIIDFGEHSADVPGNTIDFSDPAVLADAARAHVAEQASKGITVGYGQAVRKLQKGA